VVVAGLVADIVVPPFIVEPPVVDAVEPPVVLVAEDTGVVGDELSVELSWLAAGTTTASLIK